MTCVFNEGVPMVAGIIIIVLFLAASYIIGIALEVRYAASPSHCRRMMNGFLLSLCVWQIVAIPLAIIGSPFHLLYYLFLTLYSILLISSLFFLKKTTREVRRVPEPISIDVPFSIMIVMILVFALMNALLHVDSYDDGYYVGISNIAVQENVIDLNEYSVYTGNDYLRSISLRPYLSSWELLVAFFSKASGLHPAIMAHTVLPFFLTILCFVPVYDLGYRMYGKRPNASVYVIGSCLFAFFFGKPFITYLAVGIWTGKGLLYFFSIPCLLSYVHDVHAKEDSSNTWIGVTLCLLSGVALTATGIQMMPLAVFTYIAPLVAFSLMKKDARFAKHVVKKTLMSLLVLVPFLLYALIFMVNTGSMQSYLTIAPRSWSSVFRLFSGPQLYFCLFMLALITFFRRKSPETSMLTGGVAIAFLTYLNPLLFPYSQKLVGIDVAQRLFYLLPLGPVAASGCALFYSIRDSRLFEKLSKLRLQVLGLLLFMVPVTAYLLTSPNHMLNYYRYTGNAYMVQDTILHVADEIESVEPGKYVILLPPIMRKLIRQYSTKADVIMIKESEYLWADLSEHVEAIRQFSDLSNAMYTHQQLGDETFRALDSFGVKYVLTEEAIGMHPRLSLHRQINDSFLYLVNPPLQQNNK